jgi:hypothetical protein
MMNTQSEPETADEMLARWEAHKKANREMPREEFLRRFKAQMLKATEKFDDGSSVAEYADEVGPSYYEDMDQREDGPEICADSDMSYWGD